MMIKPTCTECKKTIEDTTKELYNKLNVMLSVRVCEDCYKPE